MSIAFKMDNIRPKTDSSLKRKRLVWKRGIGIPAYFIFTKSQVTYPRPFPLRTTREISWTVNLIDKKLTQIHHTHWKKAAGCQVIKTDRYFMYNENQPVFSQKKEHFQFAYEKNTSTVQVALWCSNYLSKLNSVTETGIIICPILRWACL